MWGWLAEQNEPLNVIINIGMLVVWTLYFQLLLNGYRRNRASKILINRANDHSLDTQCVVTNMSAEAIYVEGIIAELTGSGDEETVTCSLTDRGGNVDPKEISEEEGYQGPLGSGESVQLGSYQQIIGRVLSQQDWDIREVKRLMLTIVATYGPEDRPVAARREFEIIEKAGRRILQSERVVTRQIRSQAERREMETMMENQIGTKPASRK